MNVVTIPDGVALRNTEWTFDQPAQVNRGEFTGVRRTTILPYAPRWSCRGELVPLIGDASARKLRSMLSRLRGPAYPLKVPATEAAQMARHLCPVTGGYEISNQTGTVVSAGAITKTGPGVGWGDANAATVAISGGVVLLFRSGDIARSFIAGLTPSITDAGYSTIRYGFYCAGSNLHAIEAGAIQASFGSFTTETILAIAYDGATVRYFADGVLLRSVDAASGLSLRMDATFFHPGAVMADANIIARPSSTAPSAYYFTPGDLAVADGMMATLLLMGGGAQLVTIEADAVAGSDGGCAPKFWPPARGVPYAWVLGRPFGLMAMRGTAAGWRVDPGQIYGASLDLEEAF